MNGEPEFHFVYALCEPAGGTVRYVGRCTSLQQRYIVHLLEKTGSARMTEWVNSIAPEAPELRVLHVVHTIREAEHLERDEIANHVGSGIDLLNEFDRPDRRARKRGPRPLIAKSLAPHLRGASTVVGELEKRLRGKFTMEGGAVSIRAGCEKAPWFKVKHRGMPGTRRTTVLLYEASVVLWKRIAILTHERSEFRLFEIEPGPNENEIKFHDYYARGPFRIVRQVDDDLDAQVEFSWFKPS